MKPYIIKSRSLSHSDARNFAKAVLGKTAVKPEPPKPEFKPELTVTPPAEPEVKEIEVVLEEQVEEAPVVEETVVEETVVEETVVEETPAESTVIEETKEEVVEEPVEEQVAETPVEEVKEEGTALSELGLSYNNIRNLKANNINTVEALEAFVNSGEQLAALPKIGNKAEQAILEALITWKEQNQK